MEGARERSAAEAELDRNEVVRICLRYIVAAGGSATTAELYAAVETNMGGARLSSNGRACVREYVNRYAVRAGLVLPHSLDRPGWHITAEGRELVAAEQCIVGPASAPSPMSRAFEQYVLGLMHLMHPRYFWHHQGVHTRHERGLDLIAMRFPDEAPPRRSPDKIGVQVKLHDPTRAPSDEEWRKFLAGCFTRRIDLAIFVTTGYLTGEQRREASEAGVIVIAGVAEIARVADRYGYSRFEVEATTALSSNQPTARTRRSAPN
jgi:hypothetical protein